MEKNNRLFFAENLNKSLDENLELSLDRYNEDRSNKNKGNEKSKKLKFKDYKKNTIKSLNEVEFFLNNLDKAFKCVHIFKILR